MCLPEHTVFVVDDDRAMRESLTHLLGKAGFEVRDFFRAADALSALEKTQPDAVLTDMRMPGLSGLELLEAIRGLDIELPVILISAHGDVPLAVEAMEKGAYSFLEKPYHPGRLIAVLRQSVESARLIQDNRNLRSRLADMSGLDRALMGSTQVMIDLRAEVMNLANLSMPVLVQGETGTGKEVVARALHDLGPRTNAEFIAVNCAGLSGSDIGRLMFGEQGGDEPGYFLRADGGSLFLDEVHALSAEQQGTLLRIMETGELTPVGATAANSVDVRIISASNRDLNQAVEEGDLRSDLYYRLNAVSLDLPPLRNRADDIVMLFSHFLEQSSETFEAKRPDLSTEDIAALLAHDWPGNVRELRHVAERRVLLARRGMGSVADAIARDGDSDDVPDTLREAVAAFERQLISKSLAANAGRMDAVAEALGIGRRTLNEKMVKLNLDRDDYL